MNAMPFDELNTLKAALPGFFNEDGTRIKSKEDYDESARLSWENYLYMRERVKEPDKLMPVFHFGENLTAGSGRAAACFRKISLRRFRQHERG